MAGVCPIQSLLYSFYYPLNLMSIKTMEVDVIEGLEVVDDEGYFTVSKDEGSYYVIKNEDNSKYISILS